jgi:hypothetical protein
MHWKHLTAEAPVQILRRANWFKRNASGLCSGGVRFESSYFSSVSPDTRPDSALRQATISCTSPRNDLLITLLLDTVYSELLAASLNKPYVHCAHIYLH